MVRRIASAYERSPDHVDDLMQDVWLAVWRALPRLSRAVAQRSYIARIAQNICVSHVRRAVRRASQPLTDSLPDGAPLADEVGAEARRLDQLIEAVRALPAPLKAVATLYLEDMPMKEIAQTLAISEGNASVRLHRAKAAIKIRFGDDQ